MGYKKFFLKIIIRIGENWLNKKPREHKFSVLFESRNN